MLSRQWLFILNPYNTSLYMFDNDKLTSGRFCVMPNLIFFLQCPTLYLQEADFGSVGIMMVYSGTTRLEEVGCCRVHLYIKTV